MEKSKTGKTPNLVIPILIIALIVGLGCKFMYSLQ